MRRVAVMVVLGLAACAGDDETIVDAAATVDGAAPADVPAAPDGALADADDSDAGADAGPPLADAAPTADASPCPAGFTLASNAHCYLIDPTPLSWLSARGQCLSIGSILAQAEDAAENDVLTALVGYDSWLGGYDAVAEGSWLWVDGGAIGFQPWAGGEPDDATPGQDCLALLDGGTWSDLACGDLRGYVCESI